MFAACSDETVVVSPTASKPSEVKAVQSQDGSVIIITWVAAKNALSYNVYFQEEKKNTVISFGTTGNNRGYVILDSATLGVQTDLNKQGPDNWYALLGVTPSTDTTAKAGDIIGGKSYKFGVQTRYTTDPNDTYSDIAWSKTIPVTNPLVK